jgi:hypothetical protein
MLMKLAAFVFLATATATSPTPPPDLNHVPTAAQGPQSAPKGSEPASCKGRTFASAEEALQSGCCSWHNGVCGCSNGRKVCCDNTLSPSCKC